jgi:hypothetical protein
MLGCGAFRKHVLSEGDGVPPDYQEEDFAVTRTASDLVSSPYRLLERHLAASVPCYGKESPAGTLVQAALEADDAFRADVRALAPLPPSVPAFPEAGTLKRAVADFVAARRTLTQRVKAHEAREPTELFVGTSSPARDAPATLVSRWGASLSPLGVKLTLTRVRSFYARSLEPENQYQWLVQCAAVRGTLRDGAQARYVWPIYVALETGTLAPTATQTFSLRSELGASVAAGGFAFQAPETSGLVAVRKQATDADTRSSVRIRHQRTSRDAAGNVSALRTVAFREGRSFHFTRFVGNSASDAGTRGAFLSFQNNVAKVAWEAFKPGEANRAIAPEAKPFERVRYLNEGCSPTPSASSPEFLPGGIHFVDTKTVAADVAKVGEFREALPPDEALLVCNSILPDANVSK